MRATWSLLTAGSFVAAGSLWGAEFLGTTVRVPLGWLLVLTFVPTHELIITARGALRRLRAKVDPEYSVDSTDNIGEP